MTAKDKMLGSTVTMPYKLWLKQASIKPIIVIIFSMIFAVSCINNTKTNTKDAHNTGQNRIEIYDASVLSLIDSDATIEVLAEGFSWSEGPLWVDELQSLIFSDVPVNKIYRWSEHDDLTLYLESSGHSGETKISSNKGSNGLILDQNGNLLVCQHGDRRIAKMNSKVQNPQPNFSTIVSNYNTMQFNSPNDMTMDSQGNIYFTDPPYGRPNNKTGEIGINGVYCVSYDNHVTLLIDSLTRPNGIGLSPDNSTLYINQSDPQKPILFRYNITPNGQLEEGKVLFDFSIFSAEAKGLPDGLKVHSTGNIFATGPGGIHIISPEGKHLGAIRTEKATSNCAFSSDQKYLYTTTTNTLLRIELK